MSKKITNIGEAFRGLNEAFETNFIDTQCPSDEELKQMGTDNLPIPVQDGSLVTVDILGDDNFQIEDVDYLELEMKSAVESIDTVMTKMEDDIKIGSPPRMYEAFSQLASAKVTALKELFNFRRGVAETKLKAKYLLVHNEANKIKERAVLLKNKKEDKPVNINTINITSKELLEMAQSAQQNSELNEIDTNFDVSDSVTNDNI
jgi:hypothetical protein